MVSSWSSPSRDESLVDEEMCVSSRLAIQSQADDEMDIPRDLRSRSISRPGSAWKARVRSMRRRDAR